jgi:hypothetical protein
VCFVVFHSSQDHLRIGMRDLNQPISYRCKKHRYECLSTPIIMIFDECILEQRLQILKYSTGHKNSTTDCTSQDG